MRKLHVLVAALFVSLVTIAGNAWAVLDADIAAGFTSVSTSIADLKAVAIPVVVTAAVVFLLIKLSKRFLGKV